MSHLFGSDDNAVEPVIAWIVGFSLILFAIWTLSYHAATFGRVPWTKFSVIMVPFGLLSAFVAGLASFRFARGFVSEVSMTVAPEGIEGAIPLLVVFAGAGLMGAGSMYGLQIAITMTALAVIWYLTSGVYAREQASRPVESGVGVFLERRAAVILLFCAGTVVAVTLAAHRPDPDDTTFLQIAAQTLRFPDRAPLTFDSSLGVVLEPFRFAPYRLSSYETLVAFLVKWTGLSLLTVYYAVLPGLTAALSVGVAFMFGRWFLPRCSAVIAVVVFTLIALAWGEAHRTYGNFTFVRLFQGKTLLIMLTTPMIVITGLMLLRRRTFWNWTFFALANVASVGVSCNGLVCAFVASGLIAVTTLGGGIRYSIGAVCLIGAALVYPAILGAWLKFAAAGFVPLNQMGTFLPINTSLGLGLRPALALGALALGVGALGATRQRYEYGLLACASVALVLNPWLSTKLTEVSAQNMSWRLAWGAPTPLLMAVAISASLAPVFRAGRLYAFRTGVLLGVAVLLSFLMAGRWTTSSQSGVSWSWTASKLPAACASVRHITATLEKRAPMGTVLASEEVAAWVPLLAPGLRLVMPGHTYPEMLSTLLSPKDFSDRMSLFAAINGKGAPVERLQELICRYHVATLVLPLASGASDPIVEAFRAIPGQRVEQIEVVAGHRVLGLTPCLACRREP
jgi:hypothetical protein